MGLDINVLGMLRSLARLRPVFHSEADFQFAFAWHLREQHPNWDVRLETRPKPGVHLDLLISDPASGHGLAVELKYLTAVWEGTVEGEAFALLNQGAQDIRCYDCVKDVGRLEGIVGLIPNMNGLAVVLANEPSYWNSPSHGRPTNASQFRLHEGTEFTGRRTWGPNTGAGTMRNREDPIDLRGRYTCRWKDYSELPGRRGRFRVLVHHIVSTP